MHRRQLLSCLLAMIVVGVKSHGSMIYPPPRSAHGQKFDARNKCGCASTPEGCYSNASAPGDYCGLGCIGEACLYYQIGCYQSCPECSYEGKTLYPVPEDLKKAGNCPVPPAPTLGGGSKKENMPFEHTILITCQNEAIGPDGILGVLREQLVEATQNFSRVSQLGSNPSFPDPPAHGQPQFANGTDLPATTTTTWKLGSVVDAEWSIYANHGGGYSYRLCKKIEGKDVTEECFQQTPLNFANDFTTIKYYDGTREPFDIKATTTDLGTWPKGSQWRRIQFNVQL